MGKKNIYFEISERRVLLRVLDVISVLVTLYLVGYIFDFDYFKLTMDNWSWLFILSLYLTTFATVFELYDLQKSSNFETVIKNILLTSSVTILFYLLTPFYTPVLPSNRLQILFFFLSINAALLIWRFGYIILIASPRFYKKVLLIAHRDDLESILNVLYLSDPNYRVIAFYDSSTKSDPLALPNEITAVKLGTLTSIMDELRISEVVVGTRLTDEMSAELNGKLLHLLEQGVPIRSFTQVYEELTYKLPVHHVETDFYSYFPFSRSNRNKLYLFFSCILGVMLSVIGLIFGVFFIPFVLICNFLGNRGPLFYYQKRIGKNGREFNLVKLRTMVLDAEKDGAQFAQTSDVRVTKFGRFLRKSRIDEIPQFFNVLRGDMSLIGPRPERPEFLESLIEKIPFYEVRHLVKPGITGWAQVNAKYGACEGDALEKLQYDLYYLKHRSLFLDFSIMMKTLSTIIFYRGQ